MRTKRITKIKEAWNDVYFHVYENEYNINHILGPDDYAEKSAFRV